MQRGFWKKTLYSMISAALIMGTAFPVSAAATDSVLPSGGIQLSLARGNKLEDVAPQTAALTATIIHMSGDKQVQGEIIEETDPIAKAMEDNMLAFANTQNYVSIMDQPSTKAKAIGKLYEDGVGIVVEQTDDWVLISSGSVTGYIQKSKCLLGEEATEAAREAERRIATIDSKALYIRKDASFQAMVINMIPQGEELLVLDEIKDWAKVDTEDGDGWISTEYVTIRSEYEVAESKEEETARLAAEKEEREKAREAAKEAARKKKLEAYQIGEGSELGKAVVEYALQFVGNPYVWGGTSLTKGADCSGFVMKVYEYFNVELPHSSKGDRSEGYAVEGGLQDAQAGDLICYSGHVAIYVGDGKIVHASNAKTGIIVSDANYRKILAVRRIF